MKHKLYWHNKTQTHFYKGEENCEGCLKPLGRVAVFLEAYNNKRSEMRILCPNCARTNRFTLSRVVSFIQVCITHTIPKGATPSILRPPEIVDGDCRSLFITADNLKADKTNDYTKHSGRESFEGVRIGTRVREEQLVDAEQHLKLLKDAKPITPQLLEGGVKSA